MPYFYRTAALLLLAGCACAPPPRSEMTARASDGWTRSYPLEAGGEVQVSTIDGSVTFEAVDGTSVEVRAERTVHALTDESAREVLPRIEIRENIAPGRVVVQTQGLGGIVIGVRVSVSYQVRAPRSATIRARARNGDVTVRGFSGNVFANAANGSVLVDGVSGGVEARASNGAAKAILAAVGNHVIDIRASNGSIDLVVPEAANATVNATVSNGNVDVVGLNFERFGENTPRRVRGRLNAGGTPIELTAGNGSIRIASPSAPPPSNPRATDTPPERQ